MTSTPLAPPARRELCAEHRGILAAAAFDVFTADGAIRPASDADPATIAAAVRRTTGPAS